jgi:hypothetical protein
MQVEECPAPHPDVAATSAGTQHGVPAGCAVDTDQADEIDVWVRVVWERDGEIWHMGRATRWTRTHVFVEFGDERLATIGICVRPRDVRRA